MQTSHLGPLRPCAPHRARGTTLSSCTTVLATGALVLGVANSAFAEPTTTSTVRPDSSLQPQAGTTQLQIPDTASNQEVAGEYGFGLALLILGGVVTTAVLVGLFLLVARRSWYNTAAPVSQRPHSQ